MLIETNKQTSKQTETTSYLYIPLKYVKPNKKFGSDWIIYILTFRRYTPIGGPPGDRLGCAVGSILTWRILVGSLRPLPLSLRIDACSIVSMNEIHWPFQFSSKLSAVEKKIRSQSLKRCSKIIKEVIEINNIYTNRSFQILTLTSSQILTQMKNKLEHFIADKVYVL